jgi:hypothetical protein
MVCNSMFLFLIAYADLWLFSMECLAGNQPNFTIIWLQDCVGIQGFFHTYADLYNGHHVGYCLIICSYRGGGGSFLSTTIKVRLLSRPLPCMPNFDITVRHNWGSFYPNTELWLKSMVCHSVCLFHILHIVHYL